MSTRTQTRVHARGPGTEAIDGANARALSAEPVRHAIPGRERTPLSVVPSVARNRRAHFAVFCFAVMLAALAGVLVLNVQVSSAQYELVGLRNTERALAQENEALTQRAQNLEAPQNVAAKAAELGMVVPGSVASIDLGTLKVAGVSTPAEKETTPTSLVAAPQAPYVAPQAKTVPAAPQAPERPAAGKEATRGETPNTKTDSKPAEAERQKESTKPADAATGQRPSFSEKELNGGTIPAPSQRGTDG